MSITSLLLVFAHSSIPLLYVFVQPYQLLIGMLFFVSIIAAIVIFISLYLIRRTGHSIRRKQLRSDFSEIISQLAVADTAGELDDITNEPANHAKIEGWLNSPFSRKVLIRELMATAKNMSGTAKDNICWFYEKTGLNKDSLERLRDRHWHVKSRAIQELGHLQQSQFVTKVYRFTNNKNELIRSEARIAVVKLTGFEGLRFLDMISYPITEWEQLSLLHELGLQKPGSFDSIPHWLQSNNHSVVEFALRLTEVYKLYDLHDEVAACLSHTNKTVRQKTIQSLKEIGQPASAAILAQQFHKESPDLQLRILDSLRHIGTSNELPFLIDCLSLPQNAIKASAARAIRTIEPNGLSLVKQRVDKQAYPWPILLPQLEQEVRK